MFSINLIVAEFLNTGFIFLIYNTITHAFQPENLVICYPPGWDA